MKLQKIEADSLDEALTLAAQALGCAVVHLNYEVIQYPKAGFMGIGKKRAIICAQNNANFENKQEAKEETKAYKEQKETPPPIRETKEEKPTPKPYYKENKPHIEAKVEPKREYQKEHQAPQSQSYAAPKTYQEKPQRDYFSNDAPQPTHLKTPSPHSTNTSHYSNYSNPTKYSKDYHSDSVQPTQKPRTKPSHLNRKKEELALIAKKVQNELREMFDSLPFSIDTIIVEPLEDQSLYIELQGEDSALLIGKEGYRYKAISYLLFNWVHTQYELPIRLEIAEFLRNQEEMIAHYLEPVIESVNTLGYAQTKPLDGVLAYIALRQLREIFPNKYVSFRQTNDGERFVIINEFH